MGLGGGEFIRIGVAGLSRVLLRWFRTSEQRQGRKSIGSLRVNKSVPVFSVDGHRASERGLLRINQGSGPDLDDE